MQVSSDNASVFVLEHATHVIWNACNNMLQDTMLDMAEPMETSGMDLRYGFA